jgi:hypothetical protein
VTPLGVQFSRLSVARKEHADFDICVGPGMCKGRSNGTLGEPFKIHNAAPRVIGNIDYSDHFCVR